MFLGKSGRLESRSRGSQKEGDGKTETHDDGDTRGGSLFQYYSKRLDANYARPTMRRRTLVCLDIDLSFYSVESFVPRRVRQLRHHGSFLCIVVRKKVKMVSVAEIAKF